MLPASSQALYPSLPHKCESSLTPLILLSPQNFVLRGSRGRRILPCEQILISSVSVQNPPALLPPRSVYPLPIYPSCRCRSQPLPGDSRKQRYNTLDFPRESRVPRKALPSFGNLLPRGTLFPSGHPACPCSGYPSCFRTPDTLLPEQVKQAQRFARMASRSLCLFCSATAGQNIHGPLGFSWRFSY